MSKEISLKEIIVMVSSLQKSYPLLSILYDKESVTVKELCECTGMNTKYKEETSYPNIHQSFWSSLWSSKSTNLKVKTIAFEPNCIIPLIRFMNRNKLIDTDCSDTDNFGSLSLTPLGKEFVRLIKVLLT